MIRTLALAYSMVCYLVFFMTFLYAVGFVGNLLVPKSIDSGEAGPFWPALLVDVLLLGLFAAQHSVMARPAFKNAWTLWVPKPMERSTYVLFSSLALILLFSLWRPIPELLWNIENETARVLAGCLFWLGWIVVLVSTFLISHLELFGLRQAWFYLRGREQAETGFVTPLLYRLVRHPLMLGFLIAFWATPSMTIGHLVFSVATTVYILVALQFEERDLVKVHGASYEDYRRRVPMLFPFLKPRPRETATTAAPGAKEPEHE